MIYDKPAYTVYKITASLSFIRLKEFNKLSKALDYINLREFPPDYFVEYSFDGLKKLYNCQGEVIDSYIRDKEKSVHYTSNHKIKKVN